MAQLQLLYTLFWVCLFLASSSSSLTPSDATSQGPEISTLKMRKCRNRSWERPKTMSIMPSTKTPKVTTNSDLSTSDCFEDYWPKKYVWFNQRNISRKNWSQFYYSQNSMNHLFISVKQVKKIKFLKKHKWNSLIVNFSIFVCFIYHLQHDSKL